MKPDAAKKYIVSPFYDFLLLGGGSLVLLPLVIVLCPVKPPGLRGTVHFYFLLTLVFTCLANAPHFMYSYQLLYHDFVPKLRGRVDGSIRWPYIWVSLIVPALLAACIAYCYVQNDYLLFGFLGNFGLLVNGWHYAKQGFGVLVVTSIYQKVYFTPWERRILLWNANILWVYAWLMINTGMRSLQFWHAKFYALMFPPIVLKIAFGAVCLGALAALGVVVRKFWREAVLVPLSGIAGYGTALYFWLIFLYAPWLAHFHPVLWLIPSMHAIQYNTIVFKMKYNELQHKTIDAASLGLFIAAGLVLGYVFFNWVPLAPDKTFSVQHLLNQSTFFVVIFAIFISIHHFFIDNVIWRKENAQVREYLYETR